MTKSLKTLTLIRHAKSSWDLPLEDKDRPLMDRGIKDAHLMANKLKAELPRPDSIFSSHANRALHTCTIFVSIWQLPTQMVYISSELYDFGGDQVLRFLKLLDDERTNVMIFGHNYALTSLANSLGDLHIANVPTCGLVHLEFPNLSSWKKMEKGHTAAVHFPKDYR